MSKKNPPDNLTAEVLADIRSQLSQLQFGSLEISVHNGQIVQIERREKKRYGKTESLQFRCEPVPGSASGK